MLLATVDVIERRPHVAIDAVTWSTATRYEGVMISIKQ